MLVKVNSVTHYGLESVGVTVEVNVFNRGFPSFDIVGLASKSVSESRERIRTALINSGIDFPAKKIIVNLAPADIPKEGTYYDLPIAVGIIAALNGVEIPKDAVFYGELGLDGELRDTKAVFLAGLYTLQNGFSEIFIPSASAPQLSGLNAVVARPVDSLSNMFAHLLKTRILPVVVGKSLELPLSHKSEVDFSDVLGQRQAKRALEIAAAGNHNLLFIGPPGVGKSMLAKAFSSILPPLSYDEALEVAQIYSSSGLLDSSNPFIGTMPFRSPHHTCSFSGFVGGGAIPRAGELSLAHRGVLFMDEFGEYPRHILESLRQPLEDGYITISRSHCKVTFPTKFILLAASNPCPCGYSNIPDRQCVCTEYQVKKYIGKISGPILDRFDLFVNLTSLDTNEIIVKTYNSSEKSESIRKKVIKAREIQLKRYQSLHNRPPERKKYFCNSELPQNTLSKYCTLTPKTMTILKQAISKFEMSPRTYYRTLRVSRTIADLDNSAQICEKHVLEALQFRRKWGS